MVEEWENERTGVIVYAEPHRLGPDEGYNVWIVKNACPMWYEKQLFESYYKKVNLNANADIHN